MSRFFPFALTALYLLTGPNAMFAQLGAEAVDRGKKATALVAISHDGLLTMGSAFCIDNSGLFVTTAGVVETAAGPKSVLRLVSDIGLPSQRIRRAKVLRHDDDANLALIQAEGSTGFTPLQFGRDSDLKELAEVVVFGYPFGRMLAVGRGSYPDISVLPSRISSLTRVKGRLDGMGLETRISPGNSGGPVLDGSGKVVGVAVAVAPRTAARPAIPVSSLAEFLAAPGLVFDLPPVAYESRTRPATWNIQVQPSMPGAKLTAGLSVSVTVKSDDGKPRTYVAQPVGEGAFRATVVPYLYVDLSVRDSATKRFLFGMFMQDHDITVGGKKYKLSDLAFLFGGATPRVQTRQGQEVRGKIAGLGAGTHIFTNNAATIDLSQETEITVQQEPLRVGSMPSPGIEALVEVKQGSKVVARSRQRAKLAVTPVHLTARRRTGVDNATSSTSLAADRSSTAGDPRLKLGGMLDPVGLPLGAGKAIKPPHIAIPDARIDPEAGQGAATPLEIKLDAPISDVAVGGGGRFLLLTQKDAHKLAIFDVNAAAIVKTISLPSSNALVAAGAKKLLIIFPDEKLLQRWNLETLEREVGTRPTPIDGRIKALAMGADSNGPALALWGVGAKPYGVSNAWFSLIDVESLSVLRVASMVHAGSASYRGIEPRSPSGGAFIVDASASERTWTHLRAAAGGLLYGVWSSSSWPSGFHSLSLRGGALVATNESGPFAHLAPGADNRTMFTGSGERLDADGKPQGRVDPAARAPAELTVPSCDPLYYLSVGGLAAALPQARHPVAAPGEVTAAIHATGDGARLFIVHGLVEMAGQDRNDLFIENDFTVDKRFHLVPAAHLLITIPPSNDRLVLRRLDVEEALGRAGDFLVVAALPALAAAPGKKIEHQVVARSKKGGLTYVVANGPDGLGVTADGKITWQVPQELTGKEVQAVVSVGDASDREVFLTLKIYVK